MEEIWKEISGYDGLYAVSSFGRVKRLSNNKTCKEKIIKPRKDVGGYFQVGLRKNGIRKFLRVNRLVAIEFLKNEFSKSEVNHLDGNRVNNHFTNLEWVTRSENAAHSYRKLGRIHPNLNKKGSECKNSKKVKQLSITGELIGIYSGRSEASRITGINRASISSCTVGRYEMAGGFRWENY